MIKLLLITLILTTTINSWGQKADLDKIANALKNSDINTVIEYAPDEKYGNLEHMQPGTKLSDKDISKSEFKKRLTSFFSQNQIDEFKVLYSQVDMLPSFWGRIKTKSGQKFYILAVLANFDEKYRFVAFNILDKLPDELKQLDK